MAEYAVCGVLQLMKQTRFFIENQDNKKWIKNRELLELSNKTVGIVGFGSVGREVAKKFSSFTDNILGFDISNDIKSEYKVFNITQLDMMLKDINILIFTVPITQNTKGYMNYYRMSQMPRQSIIVNLSRGGIVAEKDLLKVINDGTMLGAVLDVFEEEPLNNDEIWECKEIIITPHNSFVSDRNNERMWNVIAENLSKFVK
jgi:phosphoglycerate dehydrogenase-like enzyme